MTETVTLTAGGREYRGWTEMTITRGIDRCASHFEIGVTERWGMTDDPWRLVPFTPCTVSIGADLVLTGYVDEYRPGFDGTSHDVRVSGRSRTADLIDCTPDIAGGQYTGYSLAAIASGIAGLFAVGVQVETALAQGAVANAQMQRSETAFAFLERLARLAGVLLTDDENGDLVLGTAGSVRAAGRLVQGENVLRAEGVLNGAHRFSEYILKGQAGLRAAASVQNAVEAVARDAGVPRFRPTVKMAESALSVAGMQARANWLASYAAGRATQAQITVPGYRQPDGTLWKINQVVPVDCQWLGVAQDLLVAAVEFKLSAALGEETVLTVGPVEGYTPNPAEVKLHRVGRGKRHGHKGSLVNWSGAGGIG
ncbi:MAG: hypothetical protein KGH75_01050 [Rhodospirillales bacterium]|nr:hypothetical protein [Rhodospirillales bacterium]